MLSEIIQLREDSRFFDWSVFLYCNHIGKDLRISDSVLTDHHSISICFIENRLEIVLRDLSVCDDRNRYILLDVFYDIIVNRRGEELTSCSSMYCNC